MKDFLGNPLFVGDIIAATQYGYTNMYKYYVVGFGKAKILLSSDKDSVKSELSKYPDQVVKIY